MYPTALLFPFWEGEGKEAQHIHSFPLILAFIPRKVKKTLLCTYLKDAIISVDSWIPPYITLHSCIRCPGPEGRAEYESACLATKQIRRRGRIKTRQMSLPFQTAKLCGLSSSAKRVKNFTEMIGLIPMLGKLSHWTSPVPWVILARLWLKARCPPSFQSFSLITSISLTCHQKHAKYICIIRSHMHTYKK